MPKKLYTSKIVAKWLDLSERRVRQLRDEGIIPEAMPGLYDLQPTVTRYINFLRRGDGSNDINDERAKLTKTKREIAEMEMSVRRGELLETADIEAGLKNMLLNFRSRVLSLPAKMAPVLMTMPGRQEDIFDYVKTELDAALEELSDYRNLLEAKDIEEETDEETDGGCPGEVPDSIEAAAGDDLKRMGR